MPRAAAAVNDASNALGVAHRVKIIRRAQPTPGRKIRWLLDPRAPYPHEWGADNQGNDYVLQNAGNFDLVWFGNFHTPNMFGGWTWPRSVLDVDDLPSSVERSGLRTTSKLQARLWILLRIAGWKRHEKVLGHRFSVVTVCGEADKAHLRAIGCRGAIHVVPNGFRRPDTDPIRCPAVPPRIGFVGPFDHFPNFDGIRWFARECWPRIKRSLPDARLRIVGKGSDGTLKPAGPDVDGLGWVANIADEIATWSLMIIPLMAGAGTRVKLAQAFSLKCPVVSTSLGAYGYDLGNGVDVALAGTSEAFADACVRMVRHPVEAEEMATKAWKQFLKNWTWEAITPRVWAAAESCLRVNASHG